MTLVVWGNLPLALDNTSYSALTLTVRVIDQMYALSPLAPQASAEAAP